MTYVIRTSATYNHLFMPKKLELLEKTKSGVMVKRIITEDDPLRDRFLPTEIEDMKKPIRITNKNVLAFIEPNQYENLQKFNEEMNDLWVKYHADKEALEKRFKQYLEKISVQP